MTPPAHQDSEKEFDTYKKTQRLLVKSRFLLIAALRKPEVAKLPSVQAESKSGDAVRWLGSILRVEFPDDANLMSISVSLDDPKEAAALAKAVVDSYMSDVVNMEQDRKRSRLNELERVAAETELDIRNKKQVLHEILSTPRPKDAKDDSSKQPSVEVEMLQLENKRLEQVLHEILLERDRTRIELRAAPRIIVYQQAEVPISKD
jgi:hypothetical protein